MKFKFYLLLLIVSIILFCSVCSKKPTNLDVFYSYYYLGSNICTFDGTVSYLFKKENKNVEYDINYNLGIVGRIKKSVNNKFIGEYILRDKKIFYKPLYGKNVELEDTEINRLKIDIPVNLGIDPYYFLETDLSKSTITTTSDNNIEVIYNTGAITLKELIIIKDNLINRIKIFNNNILVMEANFYNFVEIGNNLFYPQKLEIIQILPDNNKKIVINYNISRILLCK